MNAVLDAWAIIAYLQDEEPAASDVRGVLQEATTHNSRLFLSLINLGEVFYTVGRRKGEEVAQETINEIRLLPINIIAPEAETIMKAARLKIHHRLSYADAFAVVTAQTVQGILMTGDPEIIRLKAVVSVKELKRT